MRKMTNKKWIAVFTIVILLCTAVIIILNSLPGGRVAVITKNGEILHRIDLTAVNKSYTIDIDGNIILVENGCISMQSAECPDKLCVKQGKISNIGSIICLPNKVIIEIDRNSDIDAVLK